MERASKAIRRSGVRLKSLGAGHGDLNMVISELKDVRQAAKTFMTAQNSAAQDILKWSINQDNRAIQDVATQMAELNSIWTEVQREFSEHLKEFKHEFDMILEGTKHVDQAKSNLAVCEQRETKIKKELKKAAKKATTEELNNLEVRLAQAERAKDLALMEVTDRIQENEAVKLIRFKEGLLKLSESYIQLGKKCTIIFEAQRDIGYQLPDVHGRDMVDIKYTGSGTTKQCVLRAKERVQQCKQISSPPIQTLPPDEPPPPYSPTWYGTLAEDHNNFHSSYNVHRPTRQRAIPHNNNTQNEDDIGWDDYEDDLSGAMGAAKI